MAHVDRSLESPSSTGTRQLIVVGGFTDEVVRRVQEAMAIVGIPTAFVPRCDDAPAALATADPLAIVVRLDAPGAEHTYAHLRGQARFGQVPLFGVAGEPNDLAFTELFSWGGDDLVGLASPEALVRRVRPLTARTSAASGEWKAAQGCAVVASADPHWRSVMGRALYNGGFAVRFVAGPDELADESMREGVRLVVVVEELVSEGLASNLQATREKGSDTAWVVVAPPKRMASLIASVGALGRVSVADGYAPPENVLFLANELLVQRRINQRASARMLYGTAVAFRAAGRDEDEIGFSYNVSAGGLYVRTLAPLDAGQEVWLEMWPPRSERRVRLAGTVAWKRPFGPQERATVPAGFGVRITDGLAEDFDRWKTGYDAFSQSLLGQHVSA